ncbi:methyltransferase domain-containing protein [Maridesulfovibrio sp. FT414]|uniref:methyltransferase domain-containing protein n=1 Tax=Maridesulfovibrio sp. FT414 TaxID=2979469 RepID=UPI003D8014C2
MHTPTILIQASSRAWSGAPDWCMNEIDGHPVVAMTIRRALEKFPEADIRVIAPEFDRGGRLNDVPAMFPESKVSIFYGHDESPLQRMINAIWDKEDSTRFIRVDGLHFGWLPEHAELMLDLAEKNGLDCVKMPDDFPIQLTADVYRLGALKKMSSMLEENGNCSVYKVHPKFYMFKHETEFSTSRLNEFPPVDDHWLQTCRETAKGVYTAERMEAGREKSIKAGDQLTFHYELALDYIEKGCNVLDCACGPGYGARILAQKAGQVIAADLDLETVRKASSGKYFDNISFQTANATDLDFAEGKFDAVTSFETVEHVDPASYFKEMHRVIKPGGQLILSTPQNSLGHIPVNSQHLREFSLEEIIALCSENFEVEKVIGIKQGRIIFPDDPKGQNTFIVCRKAE